MDGMSPLLILLKLKSSRSSSSSRRFQWHLLYSTNDYSGNSGQDNTISLLKRSDPAWSVSDDDDDREINKFKFWVLCLPVRPDVDGGSFVSGMDPRFADRT